MTLNMAPAYLNTTGVAVYLDWLTASSHLYMCVRSSALPSIRLSVGLFPPEKSHFLAVLGHDEIVY